MDLTENEGNASEPTLVSTEPESECRSPGKDSSRILKDNKDVIMSDLEQAFETLTDERELQDFVSLYRRERVLVSVDKLQELHGTKCMYCGKNVGNGIVKSIGSRVEIRWICVDGHIRVWDSSEVLTVKHNNNIYLNDCLQVAAVLLSGNNYEKFKLLASTLKLNIVSSTTFQRFQKHFACPVIASLWNNMTCVVKDIIRKYEDICLAGDGKFDSPGFCARYCVYTLMEHFTSVIVDFEVLDSRETGGKSVAMEQEGLRRLLERVACAMPLNEITTDASTTIIKMLQDMKGLF